MNDIHDTVVRRDAAAKIAGRATYVGDLPIAGVLHARTVRSTIAKGEILSIAVPPLPQDCFVVGAADVPGENAVRIIFKDMPVFADGEVRYIGEPILLVCGPDRAVVFDLAARVVVRYREDVPVFANVVAGARYAYSKGDPEKAFAEAVRTVRESFSTGYQEQAYIEPQGMVGYPEDGGKVTLVGSMQCPYYVKNAVVGVLGCAEDRVRVIQAETGGAFGGKEEFPSLTGAQVAVAVRKTGRPVSLLYERTEDVETTTKRHPSTIELTAALDCDDRVVGLMATVAIDAGAYLGLSGVVLSRALIAATGAYTVPHLRVEGTAYLTNTVPTGAFRGFGAPQMFFAVEMFMGHLAARAGVDPIAYRRRHLARRGDLTSTSGLYRDPILVDGMIDRVLERSDYRRKVREFKKGDAWRGIGLSVFFHGCGFTGSGEADHIKARVRLDKDSAGTVTIRIASVDMGQGAATALSKIVAAVLGRPLETVVFPHPDTDLAPDSGPTVASRTTMIVGGLLARAALRLKEEWTEGSAQSVEERYVQPEGIVWDEERFLGDAYPAYSWGVVAVEVEVDRRTFQVDLKGVWSCYDAGTAIDPLLAEGQADGGLTQGIAYGYLERMEVKDGRVRQKNLTDYMIPTAVDVCPADTVFIENPYAFGPFGAKGLGELTLVGGAPAVAAAIEHAIGRKISSIPATPESIMELIEHGTR
ncbi:MAG: xanthine dehydrogenase family protein molybdopterin-binding subunit [Candidatus Izemoplasmatales bacterium]